MVIIKDIKQLYKTLDIESIAKSMIDVIDIPSDISTIGDYIKWVSRQEWVDIMDDLDQVEFIMNIEKRCNISISDDVAEEIFSKSPGELFSNLVSEKRERILNEILKDVS